MTDQKDPLLNNHHRIADIDRYSLGNHSELIYSKDPQSSTILSSEEVECLIRCKNFRTIEQHAQILSQELNLNQEKVQLIKARLKEFANKGFLVSTEDLIEKCCTFQREQTDPVRINSVCFPTRNRVKSLKRALESYIENTQKNGRSCDFVVADDSQEALIRDECKEMLHSLKARYGVRIFYAGSEEKKRFAQLLIEKGIPEDVISFALFDVEETGYSAGANRNALLLHSVGDSVISADDDTVCRLTNAPGSGNALTFGSGHDPTEFCFYPDHETLLETVPFIDQDVLAIHEALLGKDLRTLISEFSRSSNVNFARTNPSFFRKLSFKGGKVLATMAGIAGDVGAGSPRAYLSFSGVSRERFLRSETEYLSAIKSRQVLRKSSFPIITDDAFLMMPCVGLDNRDFLPPFMSVHRNQDGIFGNILRKCCEDAYIGYLPWAILHSPMEEARSFSTEKIWEASGEWGMDSVLIQWIRIFEFMPRPAHAKDNLKALGKLFIDLGSMNLKDFEEIVLQRMWRMNASYIQQLENLLKEHGESPTYWARDVKKRLEEIRNGLSKMESFRLRLSREFDSEDLRKLKQRLVLRFGQLLFWWPEIIETSKSLKAQGVRLARPI